MSFNKSFPVIDDYLHFEGNSHAHIKASLMGSSCLIPLEDGRLQLGRWQGIFFCEFDGPPGVGPPLLRFINQIERWFL